MHAAEPAFVGQMKRGREQIEMRARQGAFTHTPRRRVAHPEDVRATPEPMSKAIKRHVKRGR